MIKCAKHIQPGDEIYMSYGFNYWNYSHQYVYEAEGKRAVDDCE
jgi:hypothetical protein